MRKRGKDYWKTHWNLREVFQCPLLPGIVDQSLPLAIEGILRIGRARGVTALATILAGQVEEAGGTVIGDDALLIQLQALERPSQSLGLMSNDGALVRRGERSFRQSALRLGRRMSLCLSLSL